jgi:hypothetical protein
MLISYGKYTVMASSVGELASVETYIHPHTRFSRGKGLSFKSNSNPKYTENGLSMKSTQLARGVTQKVKGKTYMDGHDLSQSQTPVYHI